LDSMMTRARIKELLAIAYDSERELMPSEVAKFTVEELKFLVRVYEEMARGLQSEVTRPASPRLR
jgi:hypothetical protein